MRHPGVRLCETDASWSWQPRLSLNPGNPKSYLNTRRSLRRSLTTPSGTRKRGPTLTNTSPASGILGSLRLPDLRSFLTNDLSKLDDAVRSRCDVIEMGRPPLDECARVLGKVLMAEGVDVQPRTVREFTSGHFAGGSEDDPRDLRTLLASAQHSVEDARTLVVPPGSAQLTTVETIWQGTDELWYGRAERH